MSSASTCSTPMASGNRPPDRAQTTNGASSATLSVRWYVRNRRMLANVDRPCSIAATIVAKSSSSSTTSAASRATSVPDLPMATPMAASRSAGASLTPSPVIATTCPRARSARAIRSLSSGDTRATTMPSWSTSAPSRASSGGKVSAGHDEIVRAEQPNLGGDRPRGQRMIARDHRDAYARASTRSQCRRGVRPRRILEADEPEQREIGFGIIGRSGDGVGADGRDSEDTQAAAGHVLQRRRARRRRARAPREDSVGRALDHHGPVGHAPTSGAGARRTGTARSRSRAPAPRRCGHRCGVRTRPTPPPWGRPRATHEPSTSIARP